MVIKKNKTKKLNQEKIKEFFSLERKIRDLEAFGEKEKAVLKAFDFIILGVNCLSQFYIHKEVFNLKDSASVLCSLKASGSENFVKNLIEIESIKRKKELAGRAFTEVETQKILNFAENFSSWLKKMLPPVWEDFEF